MTGTTIASLITHTVTLGSAGYAGPLEITSKGTILPFVFSGVALDIPAGTSMATIVNDGTIRGGVGYGLNGSLNEGSVGGVGIIDLSASKITNLQLIYGGNGGYGKTLAGDGGNGVEIYVSKASITNAHEIVGGSGGNSNINGGDGGIGVVIKGSSTMTNSSDIEGGAGGIDNYYNAMSGRSGAGVSLSHGAVLINSGDIFAGYAAFDSVGGDGVDINGGILINSGEIDGISGNGVYLNGGTLINSGGIIGNFRENSVVFGGAVGTIVIDSGARFSGNVVANSSVKDVLEFSGSSSTTLSGIGTQFYGFKEFDFAKNAKWTISGDVSGLALKQEISGFEAGDAIILTDAASAKGKVSVKKAGVVSIMAGGHTYNLDIAGATVGEKNFTFANNTLTETKTTKMTFLAPPTAAEQTKLIPQFAPSAFFGAETPSKTLETATTLHAFASAHEIAIIPHHGTAMLVTLQAG